MLKLLQQYLSNVFSPGWSGDAGWGTVILRTPSMTFWLAIFGGFLGLIFSVILVSTEEGGILANKLWYNLADKVVSIFRVIPFVTLLAFIAPVTQKIVGTQIGTKAVLVLLTLGVFPFYARQAQVVLKGIDPSKIEAALSLGAITKDAISGIYLKEARSELVRVSVVTAISLIGLTATVGATDAGRLGNTVILYGYNRFNNDVILVATMLVIILIFITRVAGDFLVNRFSHQVR